MARKKKEEVQTVDFAIDVSKLSLTKDKFIDQIHRFIEEHVAGSKVTRPTSGVLLVNLPEKVSKQMLKLRVTKALYYTGLKNEYRLVSIIKGENAGYQLVER
jgi:hypothetical protein